MKIRLLLAAVVAVFAPAAGYAQPAFKVEPGFLVAPNPAAEPAPAPKAVEPVNPLWFALQVTATRPDTPDGKKAYGVGSGTPILVTDGKTLALTNAHVARQDRAAFTVRVPGGNTYPARRVDGSDVRDIPSTTGRPAIDIDGEDLAVLEVDADLGAVAVAADAPAAGAAVFQWGYGATQPGDGPVAKRGVVVTSNLVEKLTTTIVAVPGDSGSGVFNARGELVGVTSGTGAGYTHIAVSLRSVRSYLDRPLLARLFPRLSDRLEARRAAHAAAQAVAAAPKVDPVAPPAAPKAATPAPAPKAAAPAATPPGTYYRIGNGPLLSEAEFRAQYGNGVFQGGGGCANGQCPVPAPAARRR